MSSTNKKGLPALNTSIGELTITVAKPISYFDQLNEKFHRYNTINRRYHATYLIDRDGYKTIVILSVIDTITCGKINIGSIKSIEDFLSHIERLNKEDQSYYQNLKEFCNE